MNSRSDPLSSSPPLVGRVSAVKIVVISPEGADEREAKVVTALFAGGLERYHVRKPAWSRDELASWIRSLPAETRGKLVLHHHHELVTTLRLGGCHLRDSKNFDGAGDFSAEPTITSDGPDHEAGLPGLTGFTSRSCHDLPTLRASLGRYDSVFFGPIFPSLSKPGYGPRPDFSSDELTWLLENRSISERRTSVLALGGITPGKVSRALALGFDGVAVLGAIWQASDPLQAWTELKLSLSCHVA
jgi:thiamine-phosphate pyrophosphorylase